MLALLWSCAEAPPPVPSPPPTEVVGTWRVGDTVERWVFTTDGKFQHTSKDGWTNTGTVLAWDGPEFRLTGFPTEERHRIDRMPYDRDGYTWIEIDAVSLWRQSKEARIGAPLQQASGP
jgi:hypothetical protein